MVSNKSIYASLNHPVINAVANSLFSFKERKKAEERLESIREQFVLSKKKSAENTDSNPTTMWVRGYKITEEERKQGYFGNFAIIYIDKTKRDTFTLCMKKVEQKVKYHPQRERPKHKHPNWGHPILRYIKKGKKYTSVEDANDDLRLLHEEFPDGTIPAVGRLFIMIFGKNNNGKSGVIKYILDIKPSDNGECYIHYKEKADNNKAVKSTKNKPQKAIGKFSSAEKIRQKKKRNKVIKRHEPGAFTDKVDKKN